MFTRSFLEKHYQGKATEEAHNAIFYAVEKGVKASSVGHLLSYVPGYIDRLLNILYKGLPEDPETVEDRISNLSNSGISEGNLISEQLKIEAYLKNTERSAEVVPINRFLSKRQDKFVFT